MNFTEWEQKMSTQIESWIEAPTQLQLKNIQTDLKKGVSTLERVSQKYKALAEKDLKEKSISQDLAGNLKFYDTLVQHSMVLGDFEMLEDKGINFLRQGGVKAKLGDDKDLYIKAFQSRIEDNSEYPESSYRYYEYLLKEFKNLSE